MSYPHTFRTTNTETVTTSSLYGLFAKGKRSSEPISEDIMDMFNFIDKNCENYVTVLKAFIEIPNISGMASNCCKMSEAIELVEKWFVKLNIKYERYTIGWYEDPEVCCKIPDVLLGNNDEGYSKSKKTVRSHYG